MVRAPSPILFLDELLFSLIMSLFDFKGIDFSQFRWYDVIKWGPIITFQSGYLIYSDNRWVSKQTHFQIFSRNRPTTGEFSTGVPNLRVRHLDHRLKLALCFFLIQHDKKWSTKRVRRQHGSKNDCSSLPQITLNWLTTFSFVFDTISDIFIRL